MKRVSILDLCLLGCDVRSWPHQNYIARKCEYVAHHHHHPCYHLYAGYLHLQLYT